ncbi:MAG TPA: UDP-N-acetylmuramoyl-tripeptide--D-alanyl-D-alanine ligase [Spirochaetaceae bacterium]|nr:UDP-N-acetylmuramoyl-tripeptide--D-alanyl-D-alanine ligase [Spirochaetaceae bacterium]HCQ87300.1 UDP-N-acetylmuramoyl-tripeptide--D-alanyl-D-alanine ligase [Spirochaetaceae bacterium]
MDWMAEMLQRPDTAFVAKAGQASLHGTSLSFNRVVTDSRAAGADCLFVCLSGERVDGHDFLPPARAAGCRAFLVAEAWFRRHGGGFSADDAVVVATDTLACLQSAAKAWRLLCQTAATASGHGLLKVGITGSSGKTTVKEMVAAILLDWKPGVKNPGNLNSDIGLAASLFLLRPEHQVAIFEMGINRPGEMDLLAGLFEPDCALITNIGSAHIGVLGGSRQAIAAAKKRICAYFTGSQLLLVHEEDDFREYLMRDVAGRVACFGPRSLAGFSGATSLGLAGWELQYNGSTIRLQLPGAHNLLNALAAIGLAAACQAPEASIRRGLESVSALSGRSEVLQAAGLTIVNDCYNANTDSMGRAMALCDEVPCQGRRLYVLGAMKELGDFSTEAHHQLGQAAARSAAACVAFFGAETADAWQAALATEAADLSEGRLAAAGRKSYIYTADFDELCQLVRAELAPGDLVLIKGSRSMALERLAAALTQEVARVP